MIHKNFRSALAAVVALYVLTACGLSMTSTKEKSEAQAPTAGAISKVDTTPKEIPKAVESAGESHEPTESKPTAAVAPPAGVPSETPQTKPSPETKPASKSAEVVPPPVVGKPAAPVAGETPSMPTKPIAKRDPNTFVITVAMKTPDHPFYGKGHKLGMFLDGVPGKTIVIKRGETYEFDVETDPLHDVYFSTSSAGWGGGTVTDGIKGQFTYRGTITVTPNDSTPDVIYYQCRNHNSMGGKVYVVNKNTSTAEIDKLLARKEQPAIPSDATAGDQHEVPVNAAKQKLMLAEMMMKSKAAVSVAEGNDENAKGMIASATQKLLLARQELGTGHNNKALALADEALKLVSIASKSASSEDVAKQQRARFNELMEALRNFQDSHKQNYDRTIKKRGKSAAVDYDHAKVDALVNEARTAADSGQFEKANQAATKAERLVTQAIQSMLDSQTIVYDLNFESPAEEYEYEVKRFISYEELIPIAIEEKKPSEQVVKLMNTYVEKGRAQKKDADGKAKGGNYPDAISMVLSATEEIRRALRLAGVSQ